MPNLLPIFQSHCHRAISMSRLAAFFSASVLALGASSASATNVTFNDFSSTSNLTMVGNTATVSTADGTVLRLTPAVGSQAGAAYLTSPFTLGSNATFSTQFQFRFTDPGGFDPADGITFVLAKDATGLGSAGGGMGYQGVSNSVAIEFDTYDNSPLAGAQGTLTTEPDSSNHVALDLNGDLTNTAATSVYENSSCGFGTNVGYPVQDPYTANGCISNGHVWTVNMSYDGSLLNVSLKDSAESTTFKALSDYSINIASFLGTNDAYVGFTGGSGSGYENQDILNWTFANTAVLPPAGGGTGVPEPGTLALFAVGLLGLGVTRRRRHLAHSGDPLTVNRLALGR